MDDSQREFCYKYRINVLNEKRGYRINHNLYFSDPRDADVVGDKRSWNRFFDGQEAVDPKHCFTPDYEKIMVVEIPQTSLDRLMDINRRFHAHLSTGGAALAQAIIERDHEAARLRKQNPAVQAAWEQYSLMLHLASNGKDLT